MRARHAVAALAIAGLLGGCSAAEADFPRVASIKSPELSASQPAVAGDDQRPLIPLDATTEERDALRNRWRDCLRDKGDPGSEHATVRAACRPVEPETYEERQKRTDVSAFRDNQRQWYRCAEKAGYRLTKADENGEFGLEEVGPDGDFQSPKMEKCRKEAFTN